MDEGGQVVTLDVDQISRPLTRRGTVADVRKPLVSGLELRNAGWDFIVDNHGSRLVHCKLGGVFWNELACRFCQFDHESKWTAR